MIDLHTHTFFSDGELVPAEHLRRVEVLGYRAVAITDHAIPPIWISSSPGSSRWRPT